MATQVNMSNIYIHISILYFPVNLFEMVLSLSQIMSHHIDSDYILLSDHFPLYQSLLILPFLYLCSTQKGVCCARICLQVFSE